MMTCCLTFSTKVILINLFFQDLNSQISVLITIQKGECLLSVNQGLILMKISPLLYNNASIS